MLRIFIEIRNRFRGLLEKLPYIGFPEAKHYSMMTHSTNATTLSAWPLLIMLLLTGSCHKSPGHIDRKAWVERHQVRISQLDPLAPLTVGNGDFAFTADVTGFQTFDTLYHHQGIPLETLSTWAWHSFPNPLGLQLSEAMQESDFHGRKVAYASLEKSPAGEYFRKNPHPVPLGRIGLCLADGSPIHPDSVKDIHQTLDLWHGVIISQYTLLGQPVRVQTVAHPGQSLVAFSIQSPLLASGRIRLAFGFPYAYDLSRKNKPDMDWGHPERHTTMSQQTAPRQVVLKRQTEDCHYRVSISWEGDASWEPSGTHSYQLHPSADSISLVCLFSPELPQAPLPDFGETLDAASDSWEQFWNTGGVIDLSESTNSGAQELERRIVLSKYLVRVNYAGAFPPQETGLTHISWYGKHHSEMFWWHAAQFYQWNHTELLEKGLHWYLDILPLAMTEAANQGFRGARWPKMSGPDARPSPGGINPFIIWNQPHPIYLCELVYRARPQTATLETYSKLVFESAHFLASYAFYDSLSQHYVLGPPVKSVNEQNAENLTRNPSFELAYWHYGLTIAQQWRERMGMAREPLWDDILARLAPLTISEEKYVDLETEPDIYKRKGGVPSSMLMALGFLPQTSVVDPDIMRATFEEVNLRNGLNSHVSWSMGKAAMTAARLGDTQTAVDILCNDAPAARFLPNGHVQRPKEPEGCPAYLPANSSFLSAVALMAAGWDGAPDGPAPGFPRDGTWVVRTEGLNKLP